MRKLIFILLLTLSFGCSDICVYEDANLEAVVEANSVLRTTEEAIALAIQAASEIDNATSRALARVPERSFIIGSDESRSSEPDTLIYIVEYADNAGFAVIAANRQIEPVLAIIDEGTYYGTINNGNEGFDMAIDLAKKYAKSGGLIAGGTTIKPWIKADEFREERTILASSAIEPKTIDFKWGQNYPEGTQCPNGVSGCGPTAMFLALACIERPASIVLTYQTTYNDQTEIKWSKIKGHRQSSPEGAVPSSDKCDGFTHGHIACICRELGKRADADYINSVDPSQLKTGTKKNKIREALMGLSGVSVGSWKNFTPVDLRSAISQGIALVSGTSGSYGLTGFQSEDGGGHVWVADGFIYKREKVDVYQKKADEIEWKYQETYYNTVESFHFNWGWCGVGNGYFVGNIFRVIKEDKVSTYSASEFLSISAS